MKMISWMVGDGEMLADDLYFFDAEAAERPIIFFEQYLRHFEGRFAGKPFLLLDWQKELLREIFGWKRKSNGYRRYRTAYIEVARKNGKSALCAGILLYLLCADGEPGAQVFSVACNTDQASITFSGAKKMLQASPRLSKRLDDKRNQIIHPKSQSFCRPLSGESVGSHGKNIHGLVIDEFHEWLGPGAAYLYEALTTSFGARTQPLTVIITTAGKTSEESLCLEMHRKSLRYQRGEVKAGDATFDDTFFSRVFAADQDDAWDDERSWRKANPSLGETVTFDYLRIECAKAKESASKENTFRQLYLCQWTEQTTRWLSLEKFDARTAPIEPEDYEGQPCFIGLDLSTSYDFAAAVELYPAGRTWLLVPRLYIPKATARKRYTEDGTPIPDWIEQGFVVGMETETVDYDQIEADLLAKSSQIKEVAFDPYNATALTNHLERAGIITVPVHQTFLGMSAAAKEFERRLTAGTITIAENPALRWMAANVEIESDRHGNIRPVKPRRRGSYAGTRLHSIDGIVAAIIAVRRAMLFDGQDAGEDAQPTIVFI